MRLHYQLNGKRCHFHFAMSGIYHELDDLLALLAPSKAHELRLQAECAPACVYLPKVTPPSANSRFMACIADNLLKFVKAQALETGALPKRQADPLFEQIKLLRLERILEALFPDLSSYPPGQTLLHPLTCKVLGTTLAILKVLTLTGLMQGQERASWQQLNDWLPEQTAPMQTRHLIALITLIGSDCGRDKHFPTSDPWQRLTIELLDTLGNSEAPRSARLPIVLERLKQQLKALTPSGSRSAPGCDL
ncbi:hypothetical protein [Pseudomonas sp. D(2018)]|uniref:hypothetical protein n=1 Tax=Pseudomonas sp. D(2018) TaxID=2502238 RepID=UPI0010F66B8C|nr:hypothetical protein [Pseudomonas sp. D(2018)]